MTLDLFAGVPVRNFTASCRWYEQLLGSEPSFLPHDTEAVWELDENRYLHIVEMPDHAGHGQAMSFVDDLDARLADIAVRGLSPDRQETYENGVRKLIFVDPDGSEIAFGSGPG